MCTLNAPGMWHNITMVDYGIYKKMEDIYNLYGGKVVVDFAFNLSDKHYLVKSAQEDPIGESFLVQQNSQAISVRQLSKWGMQTIQRQCPCLKDPLKYEEAKNNNAFDGILV